MVLTIVIEPTPLPTTVVPLHARSRIPNSRDDTPQRGWSFEGSEKTSEPNMTDEKGNVPVDLADKNVTPLWQASYMPLKHEMVDS